MSDISTRIKSLRLSRNITQKELSEGIGASERGVQNYESGTRKPIYEMIIKIASFFDVSADYLLGLGIYANQDIILEHRKDVEAIARHFLPKEYVHLLPDLNDFEFMTMLELVFAKIDYSVDPNSKKPRFNFSPRYPMPPD